MIEARGNLTGNIKTKLSLQGQLNKSVEYISPTTQTKTVNPTIKEQVITPDEGVFALSSVTVNAVTNEIDENIKAENIKEGVSILGIDGEAKIATSDMVNINDYIETTITNENSNYFFVSKVNKKFPEFSVVATKLDYLYSKYQGTEVPTIETGNAKSMNYMYSECPNLLRVPYSNTSNVETFTYFCQSTTNLNEFPEIDTSKGKFFTGFITYSKLENLPLLDFSSAISISNVLNGNSNLTNMGGLKNLGKAYQTSVSSNYSSYTLRLSSSTKLTEQSLINVLNNLYDIASLGVKTQQCILGSTNIAKLTSEAGQQALATAQQKGWTIS